MSYHNHISNRGNCGGCCFWSVQDVDDHDDDYQVEGICRRRAPVAIPSPEVSDDGEDVRGRYGLTAAWPRTFGETDWCGDYQIKDPGIAGRHIEGKEVTDA